MEDSNGCIVLVLLSLLVGGWFFAVKNYMEYDRLWREGLANGHAELKISENGKPVWQWKETK